VRCADNAAVADVNNPFSRYPSVTPYLYYPDVAEAIDWLGRAFGFRERGRLVADDGTITHAEMSIGADGVIMFGSPGPRYGAPATRYVSSSLYVLVDDVDALFSRAVSARATVIEAPIDRPWGDRECALADHVGHHWYFWVRRQP
jgi:uncharacterized glyoxalase superfamily protein PhnB